MASTGGGYTAPTSSSVPPAAPLSGGAPVLYNTNKATMIQANSFWQKQPKANAELFALTYGALVAELVRDIEDATKITEELDRMGHSIGIRCIEEVLAKAATYDYSNALSTSTTTATTNVGAGEGNTATTAGGGPTNTASTTTGAASGVLSKSQSFYESSEIVKIAFRMFLGLIVECTFSSSSSSSPPTQQQQAQAYSIKFTENPLTIFVELPEEYRNNNSTKTSSYLEYSQLLAGMVRGMLEMLQFDVKCTILQSVLMGNDYNEIYVELKQVLQDGAGEEYQDE